jgi:uncharacterized protein YjbI with pentapeptide repeats
MPTVEEEYREKTAARRERVANLIAPVFDRGWPDLQDWFAHPPAFVAVPLCLVASVLVLFAVWFAGALFWQLANLATHAAQRADEVNKLLLALAGLIGAPFVVWRVIIASRQNAIALENVRNTLFSKAIEQLGATRERKRLAEPVDGQAMQSETIVSTEPTMEVRLGAIYALEKLAREDINLHWPIMETLCAYIRENAGPAEPPPKEVVNALASQYRGFQSGEPIVEYENGLSAPSVDIMAALTVLGRRSNKHRAFEAEKRSSADNKEAWRLNLSHCHLALASLMRIDLSHANFDGSALYGARLENARLVGASFVSANLQCAILSEASLMGAKFAKADLSRSNFDRVRLQCANFESSVIFGASFASADLEYALFVPYPGSTADLALRRLSTGVNFYQRQPTFQDANISTALLNSADLSSAMGLTQGQIEAAFGNELTQLPTGLTFPKNERWVEEGSQTPIRIVQHLTWSDGRKTFLKQFD